MDRESRLKRSVRALIVLASGSAATACAGARVELFDASLHSICPGQRVLLTWRVRGSASLSATPDDGTIVRGSVGDEGHLTVAPVRTTQVELRATRLFGAAATSSQTIQVQSDATTPRPIRGSPADGSARCSNGRLSLRAQPVDFERDATVAAVAGPPGDPHAYTVKHAGTEATLVPGAVSPRFSGLLVAGEWDISVQLVPGEACGTSSLPPVLALDVMVQCDPSKAGR